MPNPSAAKKDGEQSIVRTSARTSSMPRPQRTTKLSEKSTSKLTHNVNELNKKVLQFINNQ
ncbi:hypothetical protein GJU40_05340 [Bacillus lacus]|uniref:Uncharacterized protein n=1 Tax=Metabacillus lacus TaxID=1983721 RepID=A0A7X2LWL1_9BACI|nr:hypothetical protein [Metabacillus lacus]MRX71600.1 hypothetical protein [Metabacillus lacus]